MHLDLARLEQSPRQLPEHLPEFKVPWYSLDLACTKVKVLTEDRIRQSNIHLHFRVNGCYEVGLEADER